MILFNENNINYVTSLSLNGNSADSMTKDTSLPCWMKAVITWNTKMEERDGGYSRYANAICDIAMPLANYAIYKMDFYVYYLIATNKKYVIDFPSSQSWKWEITNNNGVAPIEPSNNPYYAINDKGSTFYASADGTLKSSVHTSELTMRTGTVAITRFR